MILLQPANRDVVKRWRRLCGVALVSTGGSSLAALSQSLPALLPEDVQLVEHLIHIGTAVAFISALPLVAFPKVISVGLAQHGFATSLMYLGFSLARVFIDEYSVVLAALLALLILVFALIFSRGTKFAHEHGTAADVATSATITAVFFLSWVYPFWELFTS